jgi:GT2 family glycosyltransferase
LNLTRFPSPSDTSRSRAGALHGVFASAATTAVGWIDPAHQIPDDVLGAMCAALEDPTVAAVTLSGCGRTLTPLGVPVSSADQRPTSSSSDGARRVLYAPAGLAVFHRARVLSIGGIDSALVYGHEDANLGWRLALRGLRAVEISAGMDQPQRDLLRRSVGLQADLAGPAQAGHYVHESTDAIARATRLRHETANQLATLFVCAGDEWLRAALPAALARVICLAASEAGLRPDQFDFSAVIPSTFPLPVTSVARLLAIDDLIRHFPALKDRRAAVQSERDYSDDEVRTLLADDPVDRPWEEAAGDGARALCRILGLSSSGTIALTTAPTLAPDAHQPGTAPEQASNSTEVAGVSIIVLTALGPKHLPECLDSLAQLDYPSSAIEVIVVDNGSNDDPTDTVRRHYPAARVVRNERNLGFCGGNNAGVAKASNGWLLFLNDDTRVDRNLLRALFATAARRNAASVGAFVLDWSGTEVDFAGGGMSFEGNGFQDGIGSSQPARWQRERPIPFANGAAMLVRRDAYLAAGGFPDRYFAYYEDVALGWALWAEGHQVWLSADAVVFHKHHGTAIESPSAARQRNCERNARFTVLTHASPEALPDLLSAALLLAAERVVMAIGLGGMVDDPLAFVNDHRLPMVSRLNPRLYVSQFRAEFRRQGAKREFGIIGSLSKVGVSGVLKSFGPLYVVARWGGTKAPRIDAIVDLASQWAATLAATAEWCRGAADMESQRTALQAARREDERQFASRFPANWLDPVLIEPSRQGEYERAHRAIVRQFDLARFLR